MENVTEVQGFGPSERGFPAPFGGLKWCIPCKDRSQLLTYVNYLVFEHKHHHNFAIAMDGMQIWVSDTALECLREAEQVFDMPDFLK